MVQNISAQGSTFGGINKIGVDTNGRIIYQVVDSSGQEAGKMTIAPQDADTFEKSYNDIMASAPKIQEYAIKDSSPEDTKKRKKASRIITLVTTLIGAGVPIYLTRKSSSTYKQVFATLGGAIAGLAAGIGITFATLTPPGMMKFAKASKNLSKIEIQPFNETA